MNAAVKTTAVVFKPVPSQGRRAPPVPRDSWVLPVRLVPQEPPVWLDFPVLLARKELRAPSALPVPPVQSAPRGRREYKALWVRPGLPAPREFRALRASKAPPVPLVRMALLVRLAPEAPSVRKALRVSKAPSARQALPVLRARRVRKASPVRPALRAPRVPLDLQAQLEPPAQPVLQALPAPLARLVRM